MIVISSSLVLSGATGDQSNNPVVGWHNLVTPANVAAGTEADGYPISNVANPITATASRWRAENATGEAVSVDLDTVEPVDYLAIARHNLGSAAIVTAVEGSTNDGADWFELVQETLLPDDGPALFRFVPQSLTDIRLILDGGTAPAEIAVLYVGKLLVLQRRIYVGHVPITYGRSAEIVNGRSESGDFLGRIVVSEKRATSVDLKNMTPVWYRTQMDPFIKASKEAPFFFAWRPGDYPREVGFAWMTNEPQARNQRSNGMMEIQLEMTGIAP